MTSPVPVPGTVDTIRLGRDRFVLIVAAVVGGAQSQDLADLPPVLKSV
jgi:hypothetical protein